MGDKNPSSPDNSELAPFDMDPPPYNIDDFLEPPPFPQTPPYSSRPPSFTTLAPILERFDSTHTLPPLTSRAQSFWDDNDQNGNADLSHESQGEWDIPATRDRNEDFYRLNRRLRSSWEPAWVPDSPTRAEYDLPLRQWQHQAQSIDSLKFLEMYPGDANLIISLPDGSTTTIPRLNVGVIANGCPLLAFSFESGVGGDPRASIDAPSKDPVICFLRYLYTAGEYWEGIPECPLLLHAQVCRMAEIFEVPELQVMAHANVIRETELSCSKPTPPSTLCATIRFIFEELHEQKPIVETILHYCVACFLYHGLGTNEEFKQLTFELESFTQMLCWTSMHRGFEDESAIDIIRLPTRHRAAAPESKAALGDFLFDFHGVDSFSDLEEHMRSELGRNSRKKYTLSHRPKNPHSSDESGDERPAFGFTLVHRPKPAGNSSGWVKCEDDADKSASDTDSELEDAYWRTARPVNRMVHSADSTTSHTFNREDHGQASEGQPSYAESVREWEERKNRSCSDSDGFATDGSDSFMTIKPPMRTTAQPTQNKGKQKAIKTEDSSDSEWSIV